MANYLIGIDLGTTNSTVAYVELRAGKAKSSQTGPPVIRHFPIPQLVAPGQVAARELLPSFLYLPGEHDLLPGRRPCRGIPKETTPLASLPAITGPAFLADSSPRPSPGSAIRALIARPHCCLGALRRMSRAISPVEASTRFLQHLVDAWNFTMAKDNPAARMQQQQVVLTVPASFDDTARTLTVEAAKKAGFENITLLEEPLAAFYCWLACGSAEDGERGRVGGTLTAGGPTAHPTPQLRPGDCCLVVDVGGGTSDFSLIQAVEHEGELTFVRQAVGDHLLLGGDNMDLALAKFVETRLPGAGKLDAAQYGVLTQACRQAKEVLLGQNPPATHTVTVVGRGRQVIGGTLHANLTPADVRDVIVNGFFPIVAADAEPKRGSRTGLHEMGLPYVSDPAISRHLADFLRKHLDEQRRVGGTPTAGGPSAHPTPPASRPAAILFNGGVFTPALLRNRVVEVLLHWYNRADHPWQPLELTNPSLDLAVAWGAAYFAWLKHTGGRRIGGGMARSYYVGIQETATAEQKDGQPLTVVCVVPQRLEEGQEIVLDKPELELALGQPVSFPLYTSTVRGFDRPGDVLQVAPSQLWQLPPLQTILRGGKRSGTKNVRVTLAARCTEIGTLELWCVAKEGSNRWRLEFNVRDIIQEPTEEEPSRQSSDRRLA